MISHVNVGTGQDITIKELAEAIKAVVGFKGEIIFDSSKPDGSLQKVLNVNLLKSLDYVAPTLLEDGLKKVMLTLEQTRVHFESRLA